MKNEQFCKNLRNYNRLYLNFIKYIDESIEKNFHRSLQTDKNLYDV
ncbi:hypothetical protein ACFFUE_09345 [Bergeyella porcorum]